MRKIITLILRLLVDEDAPQQVSGALQPVVGTQQAYPFRDGPGLLRLLGELSAPEAGRKDGQEFHQEDSPFGGES